MTKIEMMDASFPESVNELMSYDSIGTFRTKRIASSITIGQYSSVTNSIDVRADPTIIMMHITALIVN